MVLPYLARFRMRSGFSFLPCQYHEPTAPMNNCSPFCNEIGNDLDPDTNGGLYLHQQQRLPIRPGKNLACGNPTFLARNKSQCRGNIDHSCYLLYWSFYQIKFNLFGPKGAFYYILLNITLGKTVPHYKFGVKFSPKILKHLILVNASISLTDNVLLL